MRTTFRHRHGLYLLFALVATAVSACGDKVTFLECPLGTRPEGSECVPIDPGPGDVTAAEDTADDTVASSDAPSDKVEPLDVATDQFAGPETVSARSVGSACQLNAECTGGTCLDWPTGYCSRIDCRTSGCSGDGVCVDLAAANSVCLASCTRDSDCRSPSQACKTLIDGDALVSVCVGIQPAASGLGSGCNDPARCTGSSACIAGFPGGYCAPLGCTASTCPQGATCVTVEGRPTCLLDCFDDSSCNSREGAERKCGVLAGVTGDPARVCISGISGRDNGQGCISDFECTSGLCHILGEGRCNASNEPCFTTTAAETCGIGDYCRITANSRVGVCGQVCSTGIPCGNANFCLAEGADARATWCRPSCVGGQAGCNAEAGLACRFGLPLGDSGQGRYACAASTLGGAFFSCNGDAACPGGRCLKPSGGGAGYCARRCGDDDFCGFGGSCVRGTAFGDECWRMCFDNTDCASGFRCAAQEGSVRWVCVPN